MPAAAIPSVVEAQFAHARALWEQNEVVACEASLRDLISRNPAHEAATFLLAKLLQTQGRLDAASRLIFDWCRAGDFSVQQSVPGAEFIRQCHRHSLADALCAATLARHAVPASFLALIGHIAREVGDFDRARAHYLAAIEADVDLNSTFVLAALANTQRYETSSHPDFARFVAHFGATRVPVRARAATGFGLAKAYDDIGERASAARVLREANALVRTEQTWSISAWQEFVARRQRERIARVRGPVAADFVPVFVVGLPRSGTTLTATHLARHPRTRDRGELRTLRFIANELIAGGHLGAPAAIEEAAALYFTQARQDDAPATWYIDQDPLNFRYLHLVVAMFPQARIVLCQRDRRDTALSLWSQDFAHADCAFAYDFADIADYAAGFDALLEHWRQTMPTQIYVSSYEDFVTDPQRALTALRDFIGMPEPGIESTDSAAGINTSSIWQARQPIYTRSLGRWRAYAPFIPELTQFSTRS
jgi:tetratricopeptide (TPR) repeat protein